MDGEDDFAAKVIVKAFDAAAAGGNGLAECYIVAVDVWAAIYPEHSRMRAECRAISVVQAAIRPWASAALSLADDNKPVDEIEG